MNTIFARDAEIGKVYQTPYGVLCEVLEKKNERVWVQYRHSDYGIQKVDLGYTHLLKPTDKSLPEPKHQEDEQSQTKSTNDDFLKVWNDSANPKEVAKKLNLPMGTVYSKARKMQKSGLNVKNLWVKKEKK